MKNYFLLLSALCLIAPTTFAATPNCTPVKISPSQQQPTITTTCKTASGYDNVQQEFALEKNARVKGECNVKNTEFSKNILKFKGVRGYKGLHVIERKNTEDSLVFEVYQVKYVEDHSNIRLYFKSSDVDDGEVNCTYTYIK